jgi:hypothetical protein
VASVRTDGGDGGVGGNCRGDALLAPSIVVLAMFVIYR